MKNDNYRSVDFWKDSVMKMPDNSFFELLRCVFGKIRTPFNKQQLLNDLETFLLRDDIQENIASYIDKTDAKIITAIALFGEPSAEQLESFFSGEYSCAQLQDILVNLEERFIIYRFSEDKTRTAPAGSSRLALNPALKSALVPVSAGTSSLFQTVTEKDIAHHARGNPAVINDLTLAAVFSFISRRGAAFYRSEGVIRKKIIEEWKFLFPNLEIENIIGALQVLGLFYTEENLLAADSKCFSDFGKIPSRERMEYFSAALIVFGELSPPFEFLPPLFRAKIREITSFIQTFCNSLKPESLFHEETLIKITEILKARTEIVINTKMLLETLEKTGLLTQISGNIKQTGGLAHNNKKNENTPVIVFETGSSILMYPEIDFNDAVSLASFLNVCETGAAAGSSVVRFELDRDSAVRAFDSNLNADKIIELLTRLSGGKKDESLIWNLKDWEQRYSEVSLKKGIILKLSQNRCYLTETSPLSEMIMETIAPGIYLLNENMIDEAQEALQKAGIDIISRRKEKKEINNYYGNYFKSLQGAQQSDEFIYYSFNDKENLRTEPENVKSKYQAILEKMQLGKTEKAELSARIDRRLILCEKQLKDADIRYEKLEARHLDYAGKQNIAKQAIAGVSSVEVIWSFKGNEERIFGIPRALEKSGKDLILLVDIISNNSREHTSSESSNIRIPLAKISLIRKIKKSIFET